MTIERVTFNITLTILQINPRYNSAFWAFKQFLNIQFSRAIMF